VVHHTYTNILGKDRDLGYSLLRLTERTALEAAPSGFNRWPT
jgi:fatty acid desaturase